RAPSERLRRHPEVLGATRGLVARALRKVDQGHSVADAELAGEPQEGVDVPPIHGGIAAGPEELEPVGVVTQLSQPAQVLHWDPVDPAPAGVLRDERRAYEHGSSHGRALRSRARATSRGRFGGAAVPPVEPPEEVA